MWTLQRCLAARHGSVRCLSRLGPLYNRPARRQEAAGDQEEFLPLDIGRGRADVRQVRERRSTAVPPPRHESMPVDQNWSNVWPAARTFHPASVPLPLRQGYVEKPAARAPPGKHANAELMKIANFLHLTPPAVERHCAALRRFCTRWPDELTEERLERLMPLEVVTQDFVHATPTVRHPDARTVSVRLPLAPLRLEKRERDKLLRLVGDRHDVDTDTLTLLSDRCPFRRQNYDYCMYLLTVLYFESCKHEPWEDLKSSEDMEEYVWEGSDAQRACQALEPLNPEAVTRYADAVARVHNQGESEEALDQYRDAVLALLNLPNTGASGSS